MRAYRSFPLVAPSQLGPRGVSLFATGTDAIVRTTYYDPRVPNPKWADWFDLVLSPRLAASRVRAAIRLAEPGHTQYRAASGRNPKGESSGARPNQGPKAPQARRRFFRLTTRSSLRSLIRTRRIEGSLPNTSK